MKNAIFYNLTLLQILLLIACTTVPSNQDVNRTAATTSPPTSRCTGAITKPPVGLIPIEDPHLLQLAIGEPNQGKLCTGQVLLAKGAVVVYRVWDQARPGTLYGSWWSFQPPTGNRDQYRINNAICPEWSALDRVSVCQIKVGSKLVIGPGQSAKCHNEVTYPPSGVNQVYLPNNLQQNLLQVENCSAGAPWPED